MRRRDAETHFEREWGGLEFGTDAEGRDDSAPDVNAKVTHVRTRGGCVRLRNRAGDAVRSVLARDESQQLGACDYGLLEKAMWAIVEDVAERPDPDVQQNLP